MKEQNKKYLPYIITIIGLLISFISFFSIGFNSCKYINQKTDNACVLAQKQANKRNAVYNDFTGFENIDMFGYIVEDGSLDPLIQEQISINPTYNFNSVVYELQDYYFNNDLSDDYYFISLYNFTPYLSKLISLTTTGFYRVDVTYEDNTRDSVEVNNINAQTTTLFSYNLFVKAIELYVLPSENIIDLLNGFTLTLAYESEYNLGYSEGFSNGYNTGLQNGINKVLTNPNDYQLYTQEQLQQAIRDALQESDTTLRNVWTFITNGAVVVQEVMQIQIMPGISLSTLVGLFVGIPLLLWAFKSLAA